MASPHEIAGLIGLVLALVSSLVQSCTYEASAELDEAIALPVFTAQAHCPLQQRCLLTATIDTSNPQLFRDFVAYRSEQYEGESCDEDSCTQTWSDREEARPTLSLRLPGDEQLAVLPQVYRSAPEPHRWQSTSVLIAHKTIRYRGFFRGDPVVLIGEQQPSDGELVFQISTFYGGTSTHYFNQLRSTREQYRWSATALSIAAGVAGMMWLWGWYSVTFAHPRAEVPDGFSHGP